MEVEYTSEPLGLSARLKIQQRWSCLVSDIQSNSGGAALSVTSNPIVVELLCQ